MAIEELSVSHLVIDLDTLIHRACMANDVQDTQAGWNNVKMIYQNMLATQIASVNKYLDGRPTASKVKESKFIRREMQKEDTLRMYVGHSNSKGNFRYNIATTSPYKYKRPEKKPLFFKELKSYSIEHDGTLMSSESLEADDEVGIIASKWEDEGNIIGVISIDKDLDQIPGVFRYYNSSDQDINKRPYYTGQGFYYIERTGSGKLNLFTTGKYKVLDQMITGDYSDGIPSLRKGWGDLARFNIYNKYSRDIADIKTASDIINFIAFLYLEDKKEVHKKIENGCYYEDWPLGKEKNLDAEVYNQYLDKRLEEQFRLVKILTDDDEMNTPLRDIHV